MNREEIQQKVELTDVQKKAFRKLQSAVKECQKQNIYFYQVLETLYALNGDNVERVVGCGETNDPRYGDTFLGHYFLPGVETSCSFADDPHHVIFRDK